MSTAFNARSRKVAVVISSLAATGALAIPASATSEDYFFEETASAFWEVPHACGETIVPATLLVLTTRDFGFPDTEDADPTARVQYQAVCPDDTSYSWIGFVPAQIESTDNLKSVNATGAGTVRDILGVTHTVSFDVSWTAVGSVRTTVNTAGSIRKQREAVANGQVTFDGDVLADGEALHSTRPEPFIRTDIEK